MAELTLRTELNVPGKYYVDSTCVHCELCHQIAGDYFGANEAHEGFVKCQPSRNDEEALCQEAKSHCPVGAIGDDGF